MINIKNILEEEKRRILNLYNEKKILNEQWFQTKDGKNWYVSPSTGELSNYTPKKEEKKTKEKTKEEIEQETYKSLKNSDLNTDESGFITKNDSVIDSLTKGGIVHVDKMANLKNKLANIEFNETLSNPYVNMYPLNMNDNEALYKMYLSMDPYEYKKIDKEAFYKARNEARKAEEEKDNQWMIDNPIEYAGSKQFRFNQDPCKKTGGGFLGFLETQAQYRQNAYEAVGFYSNFMLGECSAIEYFGANETALTAMDIRSDVYIDESLDSNGNQNGYYILVDSTGNKNQKLRVYLPSDEFFKGFQNKVKSFIAFDSCKTACKYKKGEGLDKDDTKEKFVLLYQLRDPSQAMEIIEYTSNGQIIPSQKTISRGWSLVVDNVMQSGYFSTNPDDIMSKMKEYTVENYHKEYGKSEFDQWYDTGWGMVSIIVGSVLVLIITQAATAPYLAAIASQGARIAANLAIQTGAELTLAIPEAIYLHGRGMDTSAAFVLVLAFIPLIHGKLLKGSYLDPTVMSHVHELMNNYKIGKFATPADLKNYLKTLPPAVKKELEVLFKKTSEAISENNGKLLQDEIAIHLRRIIKELPDGVEKLGFNVNRENLSRIISQYIPTRSQRIMKNVKVIGGTMLAAFAMHPLLAFVVRDQEWINNPQQLPKMEETAIKLGQILGEMITDPLQTEIKIKENQLQVAISKQDVNAATKVTMEYIELLNDLNTLTKGVNNKKINEIIQLMNTQTFRNLLLDTIRKIREEYNENKRINAIKIMKELEEMFGINTDEIFDDFAKPCESEQLVQHYPDKHTFNFDAPTKLELKVNFNFREWVNTKLKLNKGELLKKDEFMGIPPDKFWFNECEFKKYWNMKDSNGEYYFKLFYNEMLPKLGNNVNKRIVNSPSSGNNVNKRTVNPPSGAVQINKKN